MANQYPTIANLQHHLLHLPTEIINKIYEYDSTYREIYDICMDQMLLHVRQHEEHTEFLCNQELDRNIFELNATVIIADMLGESIF